MSSTSGCSIFDRTATGARNNFGGFSPDGTVKVVMLKLALQVGKGITNLIVLLNLLDLLIDDQPAFCPQESRLLFLHTQE
ncbi:MAG: hypothetical protein NT075_26525 [Chloroflexi bacterium]|nr:hypothetical protein [Chloroflexota bacterium]